MRRPFVIASNPRVRLTSVKDVLGRAQPDFYPLAIDQLTAGQDFTADCRIVQAGPITICDATFGADVQLSFHETRSGYHVNIPLSGSLQSRHRNVDVAAHADVAAVYRPHGETTVTRWAAHSRNLGVKIDAGVVDLTLAEALRVSPSTVSTFAPSIDLRTGAGRSWAGLLRLLIDQLGDPDSVLHEPMTAMPFVEAIVTGFLTVTSPAYRETLDRLPAERTRPTAIRTARDIIHAEAHTPLTTAELARRCHVSVRTLQEGFQRHLGTPPMAYLRSVPHAHAHAELRAADPSRDTVSVIARRWGFTNLTRFANQHHVIYGEFPAETLRRR